VEIKPPYQVQTVTSPLVGQNVRIIEEASQIVLERGRPLIVNDVHAHYGLRNGSIRNLLSAPMRARDRVVGIIHVYDKAIGEGFSSEDQKLLAAIAAQAGVAIDNSRLVEKERQKAREVEETTYNALEALSVALDLRDTETQGHSRRVTDYTVRLAREFDISPEELIIIERGALLHDIGKIGVPDDILRKPGKLTEEEWVIMRLHPGLGYRIMGRVNFLAPSASIVLHHHERYDGQGYPHRLRGEDIPLGARAFAVADTLDAMTSDRPYRKALPYEVARAEIEKNAGTQFDPAVVDVFLRVPEEEWQAIRQRVNETYGDTKEDLAKMAEV
jgi:HD-GYP domain-containing protein (c-di-GMP phosphodiesterase class II)